MHIVHRAGATALAASMLVTPAAAAQEQNAEYRNESYTQVCKTSTATAAATLIPAALIGAVVAAEPHVPQIHDYFARPDGFVTVTGFDVLGGPLAALLAAVGAFFAVAAADVCEPHMLGSSE